MSMMQAVSTVMRETQTSHLRACHRHRLPGMHDRELQGEAEAEVSRQAEEWLAPAVDSACQVLAPFYPNLAGNHCFTPLPGVNWGPERARSHGTWGLVGAHHSGASFNGSLPPALRPTTT